MKAILVIDLPNDVNMDRVIQTPVTLSFDLGGIKQMMFADGYLKPMPEIKTDEAIKLANMINSKATFQEFADGWNACLKEIQKC